MRKRVFSSFSYILVVVLLLTGCQSEGFYESVMADQKLSQKEKLGKLLFFETSLSSPVGQDCSTCHDPDRGFADPDTGLPVSKGAIQGRYGNRNDMPVSYSAFVPPLHYDENEAVWIGGLFWDGRVNTLAEQALGPPLNPLEMANPDTVSLFAKLIDLPYTNLIREVYGEDALNTPRQTVSHMADALQAYQKTTEVNPFSSKFDAFFKGEALFTEQETRGLFLFVSESKGNCAACHPNTSEQDGVPPLFTDFTYDNLGTPKNPENPFYTLPPELNPDGFDYVDLGLGATLNAPEENGKFRVPTLRNIAETGPYMHNGVFKTLFEVVAFYNTRDVAPWPDPEYAETVNDVELGDLKLTNQEIEDIVVFLHTLTDGYTQ